jgi:hypothetical protein
MNNLFLVNETFTNGYLANTLNVISLFAVLCGVFVIISKNPVKKGGLLRNMRALLLWGKLSNSGNPLKLMIPNLN